jgi:type IV secretion system protein VirD4
MLPQELKAMGADKEVILFEGIPHPVKCEKIRYYEDKRYTSRLLPKTDVPALDLEGSLPVGKKTASLTAVAGLTMASLARASGGDMAVVDHRATSQMSVPSGQASASDRATKATIERVVSYMQGLKHVRDISLERFEAAAGVRLERAEEESGYDSPEFADGGWVSLRYSEAQGASGPSVTLHFGSRQDKAAVDTCRLDYEGLRARLTRSGFREGRDVGALGEVVVWLFTNDEIRIEVGTQPLKGGGERTCVRTIKVIG